MKSPGRDHLPWALAWLFDTLIMVSKGVLIVEVLGEPGTMLIAQVWAQSGYRQWLMQRSYTSDSIVPDDSICYLCGNLKIDELWYSSPSKYPSCIDRNACFERHMEDSDQ